MSIGSPVKEPTEKPTQKVVEKVVQKVVKSNLANLVNHAKERFDKVANVEEVKEVTADERAMKKL